MDVYYNVSISHKKNMNSGGKSYYIYFFYFDVMLKIRYVLFLLENLKTVNFVISVIWPV